MCCKQAILLRIELILFLAVSVFSLSHAQTLSYSKVRINLEGKSIQKLSKLGLETDHGVHQKNRYWTNIFSANELNLIRESGYTYETIIKDVVANYEAGISEIEVSDYYKDENCFIDETDSAIETPVNYRYGSMGGFLTYEELLAELDSMHIKYPDLITKRAPIADIRTHDDSLIYFLKVSNLATDSTEKPELLYTALHHAREPASISQMVFYLWHLLENYDVDDEIKNLVDNTNMYFIPCLNVDGYKYNHSIRPNGGGLWRKNTLRNEENVLVGVDLNRNYDYEWGYDNTGSSSNPNRETYRGELAFSEPETQGIKEFCNKHKFSIVLNYHSYGKLLIHPWGYNDQITNEDNIFKNIAYSLTEDNGFTLGTASETVGYIVNGSSDDWMYGEQVTKPKSYAFTPEMGHTFWPQRDEIDGINKTALRQNLNAARITQNYVECNASNREEQLISRTGTLQLNLKKIGLQNGSISIKTNSETDGFTLSASISSTRLLLGEEESFELNYTIGNNISSGDTIVFNILFDNNQYQWTKTFQKIYRDVSKNVLYSNDNSIIDDYQGTNGWDITTESFVTAPSSICDSPNREYYSSTTARIWLKEPFDLSQLDNAELRFYAKWDLEKDFDYVQVELSTNGLDYIPLCGRYARAGEATQKYNEPLYDGLQKSWVEEMISLEEFVGEETVYLRFTLFSDQFETKDGFYFDDLKISTFEKNTTSTVEVLNGFDFTISPNPVVDIVTLKIDHLELTNDMFYEIVDVNGQVINRNKLKKSEVNIDVSAFLSGIYFIKIIKNNTPILTKKLIK